VKQLASEVPFEVKSRDVSQLLADLTALSQGGTPSQIVQLAVADELKSMGHDPLQDLPEAVLEEAMENVVKRHVRSGSRFAGPDADPEVLRHLAKGGSIEPGDFPGKQLSHKRGENSMHGVELLRGVRAARAGDTRAIQNLSTKGWVEGTDASGGYLVAPEQLGGYVETRRATAPLRERCQSHDVRSTEVWIVTEGTTVTVAHVAESATKPNTTGSVGQKISTVHKAAGTSTVSDELLEDTQGLAAQLVATQFATQVGITIDSAIISGTGTGQPTGIRNTSGVTSTAVDGQTGIDLDVSLIKARSRLAVKFFAPDTIVMHPREAVKFDLARDSTGNYLFPDGVSGRYSNLVLDANVPTNLGAGTNESVIIVGNFRAGGYFFSRSALTIDASRDAGWVTDETIFRAVERYGFAVVVPGAFEILTGILP